MKSRENNYWSWFFAAVTLEASIALLALVRIPSESGLSLPRLALIGFLSMFIFLGVILGFRVRRNGKIPDRLMQPQFSIFAAMLATVAGIALFILRYLDPQKLQAVYERLNPVLWFLLVLGLQVAIFLVFHKNGFHLKSFSQNRDLFRTVLLSFLPLILIFVFVAVTRIGITPDSGYWGEPGVAILGWQAVLSVLAGFWIFILELTRPGFENSRTSTIAIPVTIYVLACVLWLGVPWEILQNSFYAPITPPAYVPFPYSDAGFYDALAQSILIGTDYLGGIPPRPLYVFFLVLQHIMFNQNYPAIIAAQTLVLALFPVTLYFLGKKLHSPAAGVVAAMFASFRELVGLWISSNTRVANSKILTTDFPTALAIGILCLVVIWWLEKRDLKSSIIAGGAFGLLLLFRTQSLFILPVLLALIWFAYHRRNREWLSTGFVFVTAMAFTVLPWLVHNFTVSGKFSFDDPRQVAIIYSQYSLTGNLDLGQFDPETDSVTERVINFTLENPAYVGNFIATHFLNTEIGGLLVLPLIKSFEGLREPVNLYWVGWNGNLEWYNQILLVFYLLILAFGIAAAWRRLKWTGMIPLVFNLGYALANGIARFSAWRYNLPVDWVLYFYFSIGIIDVLGLLARVFGGNPYHLPAPTSTPVERFFWRDLRSGFWVLLIAFAAVGGAPWFAKGFADTRYTSTQSELLGGLVSKGYSQEDLNTFLSQPAAVLLEGRLLYPRMYRKDLGMASANPWPAYAVRDYARLGFMLLNDSLTNVIYITRDLLDFTHGEDVILLGCQREGYVRARLVVTPTLFFQDGLLSEPCE